MRLVSRLDAYVVRELSGPLALGVFGFTLVFLLQVVFELARQIIEKRVPAGLVFGFVGAEIPNVLTRTLPMAIVLAVLIGIGRLAVQHELVALRTAGVSAARLARPVAFVALFVALFAGVTSHVLAPLAYRYQRQLWDEIALARDPNREIQPGVFYDRLTDVVLYAQSAAESDTGRVHQGVFIAMTSPGRQRSDLILARRAQATYDRRSGRISLLLEQGEQHVVDLSHPERDYRGFFQNYTLTFPPDPFFRKIHSDDPESSHFAKVGAALPAWIATLDARAAAESRPARAAQFRHRAYRARIHWHDRWALPAAVPVLALLAFPIAARTRRGGRFAGLTQAIAVLFVYYLLFSAGEALVDKRGAPAWVGPWLPVIVCASWAALMWWFLVRRERGRSTATLPSSLGRLLARSIGRRRGRPAAVRGASGIRRRARRWSPLGRLDSYLAAGYLRMGLAILAVLVILTGAVELQKEIDSVADSHREIPWNEVVQATLLTMPGQLRLLFPLTALVAALVSLTILARAGEIVALKAAGVGPARMVAPLLAITTVLSGGYFAMQETIVPSAEREARRVKDYLKGRTTADMATGRRYIVGDEQRIWAYDDATERRLIGPEVIVVDFERGRLIERIAAREARYATGRWVFRDGWRRVFDDGGGERFETFEEYATLCAESPELFGATRRQALGRRLSDQMSFADLERHLERVTRAGFAASDLRVGLHSKLAIPLLAPLLVLLGAPIVVSGWSRRTSLFGFGVALVITFVFWSLWSVTTSFGRDGILDPALAVWTPPALLLFGGLFLLVRAR